MAQNSVREILKVVRRRPSMGEADNKQQYTPGSIRMSGTTTQTLSDTSKELPPGGYVGRQGNDYPTPDNPRGGFIVGITNGDRLQDIADTHINEGPPPGRILRQWNSRISAKVGRGIDGSPSGDNSFTLGVSGVPDGGVGDAKYIQHVQIPRGSVVARAYQRTVDDSANVPAVYVSDPTRR